MSRTDALITPEIKRVIASFWEWFTESANELVCTEGEAYPEEKLDLIMVALHKIHGGIYFEIGIDDGQNDLVISSESDKTLFPIVFEIVRRAPKLNEWKFTALKPPMGAQFGYKDNYIELEPSSLTYTPLFSENSPNTIGLRVYVGNDAQELEGQYIVGLWRMIETLIGEWLAAEIVVYIEPASAPAPDVQVNDLATLETYVREFLKERGIVDPYEVVQ